MSPVVDRPIQLLPIFRERVWGRESLAPWFPVIPRYQRIGEVWFTFEENSTSLGQSLGELIAAHPEVLGVAKGPPLLVKLLFTSERLSVQVHPDDDYAQLHHQSLGKTEAWYVLEAGEIAIGFRETISREKLRAAAESGEIEALLDWRSAKQGDVIFVPAGTVHAVGAGLTICEVQQSSDITYRLYDYGRPRELHLDHGVAVSDLDPHRFTTKSTSLGSGRDELLACPYFRIERLRPKRAICIPRDLPYYLLLVCVKGRGTIAGQAFSAGQAWMVPAHSVETLLEGADSEWILTYTADRPFLE
jgi:mannose-6-phosphate isomerase